MLAAISVIKKVASAIGYTFDEIKKSFAAGTLAQATGDAAFAEGNATLASGENSHAEGLNTIASGYCSHAGGGYTIAKKSYSHAGGYGTRAGSSMQTVIGKYNEEDGEEKYAAIIGNGTADNARSNAVAVKWDGTIVIWKGGESVELSFDDIINKWEYTSIENFDDDLAVHLQLGKPTILISETTDDEGNVIKGKVAVVKNSEEYFICYPEPYKGSLIATGAPTEEADGVVISQEERLVKVWSAESEVWEIYYYTPNKEIVSLCEEGGFEMDTEWRYNDIDNREGVMIKISALVKRAANV